MLVFFGQTFGRIYGEISKTWKISDRISGDFFFLKVQE